jgi:hypothetical protein
MINNMQPAGIITSICDAGNFVVSALLIIQVSLLYTNTGLAKVVLMLLY